MAPGEMFQHLPFPFAEGTFPPQLGAVVQTTVLSGEEPARWVVHTDDNSWLIGDDVNDPNEPGAAVATHIWHAIERNTSIAALATLPCGMQARRSGPGEPWLISAFEWGR